MCQLKDEVVTLFYKSNPVFTKSLKKALQIRDRKYLKKKQVCTTRQG